MATELARMEQLIGTTADYAANPSLILGSGEIGFEILVSGLVQGKVGDGVTTYSVLPYTIGAGVDLTTDQTIGGTKTFTESILIRNQTTTTDFGQIWADDFPATVHSLAIDSREINSIVYIHGRDGAGVNQTLAVSGDGTLRWNNTIIADSTGLAGVTWGGFDDLAVPTRGTGFTVSSPATGEYDLTFDDPSIDGPSQSLVATANGQLAAGVIANVQMLTPSTAKIWVFDSVTALAINSSVTFIRNYVPA